MKRIDLNVDIGEGFPWDRELLEFATSANVCGGEHAGSLELTKSTVQMCLDRGVRIGLHIGYPDREGFGRRNWADLDRITQRKFAMGWKFQVHPFGGSYQYLKPHGAFYNESSRGGLATERVRVMLYELKVPLMGLGGTDHEKAVKAAGGSLIREGFADRRYTEDGFLVPRSEQGAVLETVEEKVAQALWLADRVDSICLHGDEEDSVLVIRAVRGALEDSGWEVCAFEPEGR